MNTQMAAHSWYTGFLCCSKVDSWWNSGNTGEEVPTEENEKRGFLHWLKNLMTMTVICVKQVLDSVIIYLVVVEGFRANGYTSQVNRFLKTQRNLQWLHRENKIKQKAR